PQPVTPVLLIEPPLQGLTYFNGQPLVQLDLTHSPDVKPNKKRLIIRLATAELALQVDEVLDFSHTHSDHLSAENSLLAELYQQMSWLNHPSQSPTTENLLPASSTSIKPNLSVLLVRSGQQILGLLTQSIEYIEEIKQYRRLDYQGLQPDLLIYLKEVLLPGYSLQRFTEASDSSQAPIGLIIHSPQNRWVLMVEQVLGLETILHPTIISGREQELWYVTATGDIRKIIEPNQLIKTNFTQQTINPTDFAVTPSLSSGQSLLTAEGLKIYCGRYSYVLPLTLAGRTLDVLNQFELHPHRLQKPSDSQSRIAYLIPEKLLPNAQIIQVNYGILITLAPNQYLILGVERALLQPPLVHQQWQTLTHLPPPIRAFFDAAIYEPETEQWILRVLPPPRFQQLSWSIKKKLAAAIEGWFDPTILKTVS
ncbi:MAG: hypothetical protein RL637_1463, partial [Pseudomonadota bacterium]